MAIDTNCVAQEHPTQCIVMAARVLKIPGNMSANHCRPERKDWFRVGDPTQPIYYQALAP
jgi:hypothetical protein